MNELSISVVIPLHNGKVYLTDLVAKLEAQRRKPDEVIVVDDASIDGSPDFVREWGERQPFPVRILSVPDGPTGSPAAGRNLGLGVAAGSHTALLDQDDVFFPEHLERLEQAFVEWPDLVLCFADALLFGPDAPHVGESFFKGKQIEGVPYEQTTSGLRILRSREFYESLLLGSYIPTGSNLWSTVAGRRCGGFYRHHGTADDAGFWLRLIRLGPCAYWTIPLSRRRLHGENLSVLRGSNLVWDAYQVYKSTLGELGGSLSESEDHSTRQAMRRCKAECLWWASRKGWAEYLRALEALGASPEWRHVAYLLAASLGVRERE